MDSDLARDLVDKRSIGGMVFYVNDNLVTWSSQKQRCVALFPCETEWIVATCQAIWIRRLDEDLIGKSVKLVTLYLDNKPFIEFFKNPVFHGK